MNNINNGIYTSKNVGEHFQGIMRPDYIYILINNVTRSKMTTMNDWTLPIYTYIPNKNNTQIQDPITDLPNQFHFSTHPHTSPYLGRDWALTAPMSPYIATDTGQSVPFFQVLKTNSSDQPSWLPQW